MAFATKDERRRYHAIWRIAHQPEPEPIGCGLLLDLCEDDLPRASDRRMAAHEREMAVELASLIERLDPRYQEAIRQRFWHDGTLEQVGMVLGVGKERCRQILNRAMTELYLLAHAHWWPGEIQEHIYRGP